MNDRAPRIAIVVPTYNSATFVTDTLDSIESQNLSRDCVVNVYVVDDCSTDDTLTVVQTRPPSRYPIQVVTSDVNCGQQRNVNRGLLVSTGGGADWVFILHSDDIAKPAWLETILSRIQACDRRVGTICSSWDNLFVDGKVEPGEDDPDRSVEQIDGNAASIRATLLKGCWWHVSGCAIRSQTLGDVGLFDPHLQSKGDWDWLLRCLRKGWSVEYIPRALILYRQHRKSVSATSFASSRDLLETLSIARRNADVITNSDAARFHIRQEWFLVRRMARALSELQIRRIVPLMGVMVRTLVSAVKCLAKMPAEVTLTQAGTGRFRT